MGFTIGVKFCGGCTPGYDRVSLVSELKNRLAGRAEFVPLHVGDPQIILIIAGCRTACVDRLPFKGKKFFVISDSLDVERFINFMNSGVF